MLPQILSIVQFYFTLVNTIPVGTKIDDVFIAVKTSAKFHKSRLEPVIKTWYRTAPPATYFFTDALDPEFERRVAESRPQNGVRNAVIQTNCPSDHSRTALSCKMEAELTLYLESGKSWFCHLDDDNYLNTPALLNMLSRYPDSKEWYLGKVSIPQKLEMLDRMKLPERKTAKFWFATGGAGFCISRPLAEKMRPHVVDGEFQKLADIIRLPDDVSLGYLIEVLLSGKLVQVPEFHSHLEPLRLIKSLTDQITFSYSTYEDTDEMNVVEFDDDINVINDEDETRFYKIHCKLFGQCQF